MARDDDDGEGSGIGKYIILGVVLLAGVGAYFAFSGKKEPVRQKAPPVVQLKILPPPPPPPPPPKVPPPEPQKVVEAPKMAEPMKAVTPSTAPKASGPAPSGLTGAGKGAGPLGGDGNGNGDGSGNCPDGQVCNGSDAAYYAAKVQSDLSECIQQDGRLSHVIGQARFVVSVDTSGRPTKLVFQSRLDNPRDTALLQDIVLRCHLDEPPSSDDSRIHVNFKASPSH